MNEVELSIYTKVNDILDNEKKSKKLTTRCLKACTNYIICNNINDPNDYILSLKIDYLIHKLNTETITKILKDEMRVKDLLYDNIFELDAGLRNHKEFLSSKIAPLNTNSCNFYNCPRCKAKDHTYKEIVTRASDEPRSVKCVCLICNFKFSVG
jgi:DNA-directed RNA polymerase subunit M/transcription elongation factor TFIIS